MAAKGMGGWVGGCHRVNLALSSYGSSLFLSLAARPTCGNLHIVDLARTLSTASWYPPPRSLGANHGAKTLMNMLLKKKEKNPRKRTATKGAASYRAG